MLCVARWPSYILRMRLIGIGAIQHVEDRAAPIAGGDHIVGAVDLIVIQTDANRAVTLRVHQNLFHLGLVADLTAQLQESLFDGTRKFQ